MQGQRMLAAMSCNWRRGTQSLSTCQEAARKMHRPILLSSDFPVPARTYWEPKGKGTLWTQLLNSPFLKPGGANGADLATQRGNKNTRKCCRWWGVAGGGSLSSLLLTIWIFSLLSLNNTDSQAWLQIYQTRVLRECSPGICVFKKDPCVFHLSWNPQSSWNLQSA